MHINLIYVIILILAVLIIGGLTIWLTRPLTDEQLLSYAKQAIEKELQDLGVSMPQKK